MYNGTPTASQCGERRPSVALIGAGTMGSAIARRLLNAGTPVHVWNRNPQPALALADLGATAFDDPGDAVATANVVLTLLPTAEILRNVMIGQGVVRAMVSEAVWAQMGTIGIEATEHLNTEVGTLRPDVHFVDAPVSGGRHPAESGQLLVLASGPQSAMATVGPVFDVIGRRTLWLGPAGMGSRMKLVLNTWLAFEVEAAAEADALAGRFGITARSLADALEGNPTASPLAAAKLAKIQSGDHAADFALQWELKDLDLMRASAGSSAAPIAAVIADRWRTLVDEGFGSLDVSAARLDLDDEPLLDLGEAQSAAEPATDGAVAG